MTVKKTIVRPNNKYDFFRVVIGNEIATFDCFEDCVKFCHRHWQAQSSRAFCFALDDARVEGEYDFCLFELFATLSATI